MAEGLPCRPNTRSVEIAPCALLKEDMVLNYVVKRGLQCHILHLNTCLTFLYDLDQILRIFIPQPRNNIV